MSIYIAHRRRKTSNALDTLVLSEQECFQWTSERLVTTRRITMSNKFSWILDRRVITRSLCFCVPGIYYKSPKQNPAEPPAACRGASDCRIDVQPHIISQRGGRPTHRPVGVPLESRLYHHTSVVSQSHDCLDVVRPSAIRRDAAKSQSSSALVVPPADNQRPSRRRRRPDVAETSFMELSSTERVQVDLPQRPTVLPVGKHAGPACHQKSSSGDNFDESVNALTTESGLGGSMPCLPSPGDDLAPDEDRVRDVLVPSALSTMSSSCQGTGLTSASAHSGVRTRSYHRLHHDDEGYLTKESNTSTSSVDTSRHSPVFFWPRLVRCYLLQLLGNNLANYFITDTWEFLIFWLCLACLQFSDVF